MSALELYSLKTELLHAIAEASDLDKLEEVRVAALGRKGRISELMQALGSLPPDERKADLACLIAIPPRDRHYDPKQRTWTISHPMRYLQTLPVLKPYITHMAAKTLTPFTGH